MTERKENVKKVLPCIITCLLVGMLAFLPSGITFAAPSANQSETGQTGLNSVDPVISNPGAYEEAEVDMEQIKMARYRKSVLILVGFAALILAIVGIKLFYDMVILPRLDDVQPKKKKKKPRAQREDDDEEEDYDDSEGEFQYESIDYEPIGDSDAGYGSNRDDSDEEYDADSDLDADEDSEETLEVEEEPLEFDEEYVGDDAGKEGGN